MADSVRLAAQKALTTLLESISDYDLAGKVFRGRTRIGVETQMPALCIFEQPPEEGDRVSLDVSKDQWVLGIKGFVVPDNNHPTDAAHQFMAAVKSKLFEVVDMGGQHSPGPNFMLGKLIDDLQVDGGMCFAPDETSQGCYFGLKLTVTITDNLGAIYVQ